jgi:hypothetical protein
MYIFRDIEIQGKKEIQIWIAFLVHLDQRSIYKEASNQIH